MTKRDRALRLVTAAVLLALAASACVNAAGETQVGRDTPEFAPVAETPAATPPRLPRVKPVTPTMMFTASGGASERMAKRIGAIKGVAAAARVALGSISVETPLGPSSLSVAAVEPLEYRPLAPAVTAREDAVWRGLLAGEIFLAHEEVPRLGIDLGDDLAVRSEFQRHLVRVGGAAASASPNLAGGLLSLRRGRELGLGAPTMILIALKKDASRVGVERAIKRRYRYGQVEAYGMQTRAFLSGSDTARLFEGFRYVARPDGTIEQDPAWVRRNIVTRTVPILGSVTCHRLMIPQMAAALQEIRRAGLAKHIDTSDYGGCWVPRFIGRDPHRPISMHAWGLAFDINVQTNLPGARPTLHPKIVEILERWGFRWGGRWSPPDAMHFELAALVRR